MRTTRPSDPSLDPTPRPPNLAKPTLRRTAYEFNEPYGRTPPFWEEGRGLGAAYGRFDADLRLVAD